ncbi:hypothetical protein Ciccas_002181 [Cichlidogyrus casuarinus]|uniref:Uncharacterized protein n=1 Tax=Cichlidogyrus casuarinus TaxID=1844966 RepID=A0ABD2QHY8_9PLAT
MASSRTANILKSSSGRSDFGKSLKEDTSESCSADDSCASMLLVSKRKRGPGRPVEAQDHCRILPSLSSDSDSSLSASSSIKRPPRDLDSDAYSAIKQNSKPQLSFIQSISNVPVKCIPKEAAARAREVVFV